ncbi:MAG TPA: hypothetical protein VFW38_04995, partial [Solirubrobacteraceae bacterium]|nr:hypothetical protein [Solirubrobacteraceae bacterium]
MSTHEQASATAQSRLSVLLVALFALFALFAFAAATASATPDPTRHVKEVFGSVAQPSFTGPDSLAVEASTGDVVVANRVGTGTGTVERFKEDGSAAAFEH